MRLAGAPGGNRTPTHGFGYPLLGLNTLRVYQGIRARGGAIPYECTWSASGSASPPREAHGELLGRRYENELRRNYRGQGTPHLPSLWEEGHGAQPALIVAVDKGVAQQFALAFESLPGTARVFH